MEEPVDGRAEMVFSGDELLRGDTVNTNQSYLGQRFLALGFFVTHALCVADDLTAMKRAIGESLARRPAVLVLSGGLGPTADDLTREAVASALNTPLEHHEELLEAIRERFASRGLQMAESNRKQASVPRGATVLPFAGTAPGFILELEQTLLVALPGVPWELKEMWEAQVEPLLRTRGRRDSPTSAGHEVRRLRVFGLGESLIAQELADLDWLDPDATIGTRANLDGVTIILRGRATTHGKRKLDRVQKRVQAAFGDQLYSLTNEDLQVVVGDLLRGAGQSLAVAESCTGGMIGKRLTEVPGSSEYYLGGVIAYDNRVKTEVLGVPAAVLAEKGAVSQETAAAMAEGARRTLGADCSLSTTGIAGPSGGTDQKPVGLVYVGSVVDGVTRVERFRLIGGREQIRERAAFSALDVLRRRLTGTAGA
jgi:nicotinamide-nucleotide amidase